MSSTLDRSNGSVTGTRKGKAESQGRGANASGERLPKPNKVRRPVMALASTVLIFASIAIFAGLYANAGHRIPIVAVVRPVHQGQQISSSDLGVVNASISGSVQTIPYSAVGSVVGKQAAVALVPGSILTPGDISTASRIPAGDAIVGIALKPGQLPSAGVVPGEQVMVVQTGQPGSPAPSLSSSGSGSGSGSSAGSGSSTSSGQSTSDGVLVPRALVYDVATPSAASGNGSTQLVSVELAQELAPAVSVAAAAGQVSIVVLPQGSLGS
jgi:hypothetical protein